MTHDKHELIEALRRRERDCNRLAEKYSGRPTDEARCRGKAQAYGHAADLVQELDSEAEHISAETDAPHSAAWRRHTLARIDVLGRELVESVARRCEISLDVLHETGPVSLEVAGVIDSLLDALAEDPHTPTDLAGHQL